MNNKKTIFAKVGLVFAFGFLSAPIIKADVITTTIPYVDDNGVKYVNIEDLARASKGTVVENEESIDIVINDAILSIYPEKGAAFLDGDLIPLKTKTVIDNVTGETFEFPICEKITENDGGHLIPVSVVSKSFGIEGEETGYVIKTEVKTEKIIIKQVIVVVVIVLLKAVLFIQILQIVVVVIMIVMKTVI